MKRKAIFSALLLGSSVSSLSPQIFASIQDSLSANADIKNKPMNFISKDTFKVDGKNYKIKLSLSEESDEPNKELNKLKFAYFGSAVRVEVDSNGKEIKSTITSFIGDDYNVLLELVHEDDYEARYFMFGCGSTYSGCELPDTELSFVKTEQKWYLTRKSLGLSNFEMMLR